MSKIRKEKIVNIYTKSFCTFFKIGLFTLGGGYAMIPMIESEVVTKNHWLTAEEFMDQLAVAQSAPGVFAVNMSIFIGYKLRGLKGCLCTALGTILPSFLIILAIALFFEQFKENRHVEAIFKGIRPAVVALIAAPCIKMAAKAKINRKTLWIPIVSILLICACGLSPIYIILAAAIGGIIYQYAKEGGNQ